MFSVECLCVLKWRVCVFAKAEVICVSSKNSRPC